MSLNKRKMWIDAGIKIASDFNAKVLCPECQKANLSVGDITDETNTVIIERIIYCDLCGAKNHIRINKKVEDIQ